MKTDAERMSLAKTQLKKLIILLSIVLAAVTISRGQEPVQSSRVVDEIRNLERSKYDALQRKDNSVLDAILDDDLLRIDQNGNLWTKAAYLANLHNPNWQLLQIVPESMNLQLYGEVAIVAGIYHERGVRSGHPYVQRCRFIDTWVFKKSKWVCVAATATSVVS